MNIRSLLVIGVFTVFAGSVAMAADRGTPDEAKAMAIKAAQYLKDAGPEVAFAAFSAKDSPWHDRDLYVFVSDQANKMLANGSNPALVGRTMTTLKDADGKSIASEIVSVKDAAWIDYKWQNPVNKAIEPKVTYVVRVGDYSVGVGAYK
jgi:cytochrome c